MKSIPMKSILLFRSSFSRLNRLETDAIFRHAHTRNWSVHTVEYMNAAFEYYREAKAPDRVNLKALFDTWHPDGCIIECCGSRSCFQSRDFRRIPTVFLDQSPSPRDKPAVCVYNDSEAIAKLAAKELLQLGLDGFAFVKWFEPLAWSEKRGEAFRRIILQHGKTYHEFTMAEPCAIQEHDKDLARFLLHLPKPCGIFAVNDICAKQIATACAKLNISIPEDVAIVSVDNDETICENLPVTLTSIEPDFSLAGRIAAELLDSLMLGRARNVASRPFGVKKIVRRASANGMRTHCRHVSAAIEFIRTHACQGITPSDVIREIGCSASLANLRFRQFRKATILDEIHLRRIEQAKEQLRGGMNSIETIAGVCGYASATDFSRTFKRYVGKSPLRWKKGATP